MPHARTLRRLAWLALVVGAAGVLWARLNRPAPPERNGHVRRRGSFDDWPAVPRAPGAASPLP